MSECVALEHGYYEDIYEVLELYRACGLDKMFAPAGNKGEEYPSYETVEFDLDQRGLYVMRGPCALVAAVSIITRDGLDEEAAKWPGVLATCVMARLAVHPDYQRSDINVRIVDSVCQIARELGCQTMQVLVPTGDLAMLKQYQRLDFRSLGIRRMHGRSFLLFAKPL